MRKYAFFEDAEWKNRTTANNPNNARAVLGLWISMDDSVHFSPKTESHLRQGTNNRTKNIIYMKNMKLKEEFKNYDYSYDIRDVYFWHANKLRVWYTAVKEHTNREKLQAIKFELSLSETSRMAGNRQT